MAVTTLDPKTALLVVDLQTGIVGMPTVHPIAGILDRARALLDAFRQQGLPVVLINVDNVPPGRTEAPKLNLAALPAGWTDFVPQLDQQPSDIVVTKRSWGVFATTDLEAQLRALEVTQVVVLGVATGSGVESTARQAYEAGFNVTIALDAITDMRPEAHDNSVNAVFPRLGETGSADDIIALLSQRNA